MNKIFRPS